MELFLQLFITGILVGSIYALVALGWTLIYKCSGVLNLAMGELTLIGAYVCLTFYQLGISLSSWLSSSPWSSDLLLGLLTEHLFLRPMVGEPVLSVIMVTVGLSFFFKGVVELIWGTDTVVFTPPVFPMEPIFIGKIVVGQVYLWAFIASIVLLIAFVCFLQIHQMGTVHAGHC